MVSTDPPYYDNIGYADLSDFFYIWMRHSLKQTYPNLFRTMLVPKADIFVSYSVAEAVGQKPEYIRNSGLEDEKCKEFILKTLRKGPAKKDELMAVVGDLLPAILSEEKKRKKLSNLLRIMKTKDETIDCVGKTTAAVWFIRKD